MLDWHLNREILTVVLAGGYGSRLGALTRQRCKPALPFGARYRSIDFTLSNCVNSGITRIGLATQYHAHSLITHVQRSWWPFLNRERGEFIELWAAEQREEARWYEGTADAVYQNLAAIERYAPRYVLVLAADHIYRMDYTSLIESHRASGAGVTVACQPVPPAQARHFGIASVDDGEIVAFREKPLDVVGDDRVLASMGVYVFDAALLQRLLREDAARHASRHDFGADVIPACVMAPGVTVAAHSFHDPCSGDIGYWRDIGTVDAYWAANMELLAAKPALTLDDPDWPIWAPPYRSAPTYLAERPGGQSTRISRTIVAGGCRLEGVSLYRSIVSENVQIGSGSVVEDSIVLPGARIGANCHVRRAIVDEDVELPDGSSVGLDTMPAVLQTEVSPGGITVVSTWVRPESEAPARQQSLCFDSKSPAERKSKSPTRVTVPSVVGDTLQ